MIGAGSVTFNANTSESKAIKEKKKKRTLTLRENRKHIRQPANLFERPTDGSRLPLILGSEVTLGDLHANAIKLLHFLLMQNFFEISEADYQRLLNLYYKQAIYLDLPQAEFTQADRKKFEDAIKRLKVNPKLKEALDKSKTNHIELTTLIRLIGDETGDRGFSDLLVMLVLEPLVDHEIPYKILASNHGFELLRHFEKNGFRAFLPDSEEFSFAFLEAPAQAVSMLGLAKLIENGVTSPQELARLYEKTIYSKLDAIDFNLDADTDSLTLYTHGRVGLRTMKALAEELSEFLGRPIDRSTRWTNTRDIAKTLQQIKDDFVKLKEKKQITDFMDFSMARSQAFFDLLWSRKYKNGDGPNDVPENIHVHFVHGHTDGDLEFKEDNIKVNVTNLDNMHGKSELWFTGEYSTLMEGPKKVNLATALETKCELEKQHIDDQRIRLKSVMESKEQETYVRKQLKTTYKTDQLVAIHIEAGDIAAPEKEFKKAYQLAQKTLISLREKEESELNLNEKEVMLKKYAEAKTKLHQALCYYLQFQAPELTKDKKTFFDGMGKLPFSQIFFFEMVIHAREMSLKHELELAKANEKNSQLKAAGEIKIENPDSRQVIVEPDNLRLAFSCLDKARGLSKQTKQCIQTANMEEAESKFDVANDNYFSALQWHQLAIVSNVSELGELRHFATIAALMKIELAAHEEKLEESRQSRVISQISLLEATPDNAGETEVLRWHASNEEEEKGQQQPQANLSSSLFTVFSNPPPSMDQLVKKEQDTKKSSGCSWFSIRCGGK